MNYAGIAPSVLFRSKAEKLFFLSGAESVIMDPVTD